MLSAFLRSVVVGAVAVGGLVLTPGSAAAAASLTVTPITWDSIGLDSNDPADGPARFPVGVRVCNTGTSPASDVRVRLVFDSASTAITASGPSLLIKGDLPAGDCVQAFFAVDVARDDSSYGATRDYHVTASGEGLAPVSTGTRTLVVRQILSQNRNSVSSVTGPTSVFVGGTYTYTVVSHTGTFPEGETFLDLPLGMFEILSVGVAYEGGATTDEPYAASGLPGGSITLTYRVRVTAAGTARLSGVINDRSGAAYHYNSGYGAAPNLLIVTAAAPPDLRLSKAAVDAFMVGERGHYRLTVRNVGGGPTTGPITLTEELPVDLSLVSADGIGWDCDAAGQTLTCTFADELAAGAETQVDLTVHVLTSAGRTVLNTARVRTPNDPDLSNNRVRLRTPVGFPPGIPEPPAGDGPGADGPGADGPGTDGPGAELPATGLSIGWVAVLGLGLVLTGVALLRLGGRRRAVSAAPAQAHAQRRLGGTGARALSLTGHARSATASNGRVRGRARSAAPRQGRSPPGLHVTVGTTGFEPATP